MLAKSADQQVIPQQSTQNKLWFTNMREKPMDFLWYQTGSCKFSFRNNFVNLCSFAKVSVAVQPAIPCLQTLTSCIQCLHFVFLYDFETTRRDQTVSVGFL